MKIAIYNRWLATLGGGERYSLAIADYLSRRYAVDVISQQSFDPQLAAERLGVDLSRINVRAIPQRQPAELAAISSRYDFFVNASNWDFFPSNAAKSALVIYFPFHSGNKLAARIRYAVGRLLRSEMLNPVSRSIFSRSPALQTRLENLIDPDFLTSVDTYCQLWSISAFTKDWTQRYWQRPSELLYPPVDVETFHPKPKEPIILNVGRFFAGNHNKKHLTMIKAFKALMDQGLQGWELHLAGGLNQGALHADYLQQIRNSLENYPIFIHADIPRDDLIDLYERSAIYWHASGFGEDQLVEPHKFEHFGITTVEAMAAGAIPIVINSGGQPELVEHNHTGLLWQSLPELLAQTRSLIDNPALLQQLSAAAVQQSRKFSQQRFYQRLDQLLLQMEIQPVGETK